MKTSSLDFRIAIMPALIAMVPKLSDLKFEKTGISEVFAKLKSLNLLDDETFMDSTVVLKIGDPEEAVTLLALYFARTEPMSLNDYLIVRRLRSPSHSPDINYSRPQSIRERGKSFTSTKK